MNTTAQPDFPSRAALAGDAHRPHYHFLPPANWMNDPNGLIDWQGQVHLFYQYNPHGAFHGTIHWGHAVSDDRVHWRDLPLALAPTPGGPDAGGCWSGCAVDHDGVPTLLYTGVMPQVVCAAVGSPDLLTWTKPADNPVIAGPPTWLRAACAGDFRDPFVWRAGDGWHLIIASHIANAGGCVLHYRSPDLVQWDYLGVLLNGDAQVSAPVWTGTIWECPNLLDFGEQQALIISTQGRPNDLLYAFYHTGCLHADVFDADPPRILAHGPAGEALYAPQVTRLADGRYLLFGWLREGRSDAQCIAAGWSGVMSLPLLVALRPDGALAMQPDPALQQLRDRHWRFTASDLAAGHDALLPDVGGDCLEIIATFAPASTGEYGLKLRCSPDGREFTRLSVAPARRTLTIEREHASLDPAARRDGCTAPLLAAPGEPVTLHIFLDRSVIELFTDDGRTLATSRIYPTLAESLGVALFSRGGAAQLLSLDIWSLRSIW
jgi:beta-fructofuranosidase